MLGLAGFLVVSWALITYGLPIVMPFVLALVFAELINPPITWLTKKLRLPRGLSTAVVLVILVGIIAGLLTIGISYLVIEIEKLIANMPYLYALGLDLSNQIVEWFAQMNASLPASVQSQINSNLSELQSNLSNYLKELAGVLGLVTSLPGFLVNVLIATVATFFLARDRDQITGFLLSLFPVAWRSQIRQVKTEVWSNAMGWAKAQSMLILLTMVEAIIGLSIIGANYAVLVGILVGGVDVLPVLGPGAVFVPWALYALFFGDKIFALKLIVLYAIITAVRQALESKLVGDRIGLHPLAVLLAIFLGIQFFGALGVLWGPLITILLKAMITSDLLPIFPDESRKRR